MVAKLQSFKRVERGRRAMQLLRWEGKLPAVVYNREINRSIILDETEFVRFLDEGERIFELDIDGKPVTTQLIDLQYETPAERIIHADFLALTAGEKVEIEVPLVCFGEAVGVKEGGVLSQVAHNVSVRCEPANVPANIRLDVSNMNLHDTLHASDLELPEGVELVSDETMAIAVVTTLMEEPEPEEVVPGVEPAEPELIGKAEKEGEEDEEEETAG